MNKRIKPKFDKYISYTFIGILVLLTLVAFPQITSHLEAQQIAAVPAPIPVVKNYFASTTIQAKAAYVFDIHDQKVLYEKNANTALPLASLTKIMTAITALNTAPTTTVVTISPESLQEDGDSGLYGYEQWTLKNLLSYTLVVSSNDGAAAIAQALGSHSADANVSLSENLFVQKMNSNAQTLGLTKTVFYNPTGLDLDTLRAGAYGSAKDVANLLAYAVKNYPDIIDATSKPSISVTSLNDFTHTAPNTDVLVSKIPGLIAGKTGYTDLAGGNLAVTVDVGNGHQIVAVVLGSTYDGRFDDVAALIKASEKAITKK